MVVLGVGWDGGICLRPMVAIAELETSVTGEIVTSRIM